MPKKGLKDGITKESPNRRNLSNSAKTTRGDCGLPVASQDVAAVKPPSMPSTSFSMGSGGIVNASDLKQMRMKDSSSPSDSAKFGKKHPGLQAKPKSLQRMARHWLWKAHDASKRKKPVCEKFELEAIDSTINSSLFDDPPYEKGEISFSDPPSCCGETAAEKYVGVPPDVQQNNSINYDFGDWPQSGDTSTKALCANRCVETDGWDGVENICFGFCGLCSRRTKRSLKPSKRQPNLGSGDQKPEAFGDPVNSNVDYTIPQDLNCVTRDAGEARVSSQTQREINGEINREDGLTKVDEEEEKSYSSSSKLQKKHLDDSYSSGPESEQLCKRLRCLGKRQGMSLLSIHEDDVDDWSAVGTQLPLNQTSKLKNCSQIAQSSQSPPSNHASRPQSLGVDEQFNCCNAYADSLVSSRQTCLLQNGISSLNSQSQEMAHPYYLNSAASTSGNVYDDVEFDRPQTYVHPKSNASLPELNGHKDKYNTFHKISSLSSFFDTFPCAETMWCNPSSNDLKRCVFERPRNESEALSQRTYVIAKIDLAESFGARTYSIPSNSHSEADDTAKNECLKQHNNNATNETPPKVDFALPGMVQKPPSFLSLIKEARAANMIPPSLSAPSYSWEKKEVPEDDGMTLPARRPKQQKQLIDESGRKITPKNEVEGVMETKSVMPSPQVNQNSTTEPKVPSLQSVIETMQKLKTAEMQMKAKKENERIKQISGESEKAITASQAIENAKGTLAVDYKERRRLRQQKELEEARKEVLEATRNALRDRIAFSKKEGKNTSSPGVSKTLFCGSTKAMFNPDASLGDIEKVPEKVEENEAFTLEPVAEEPKTKPTPCPISIADVSKMEVEKVEASKFEGSPKKELESTPLQSKKSRKKATKQVHENRNVDVPPQNMQIVPAENTLAKPIQSLAMPSQMIVPVPVTMPQCGMMLPFSFPQYSQPNFYYIQNPWEFMEHRSGIQRVYISETSSSGSISSRRNRRRIRSKPRRREESSSFSSFSETSSFSSDTTFSTDSASSEPLMSSSTSATSSSPDGESTSSTSSLSDALSRASPTTSHSSTSQPPTTPRSSDSSSCKD